MDAADRPGRDGALLRPNCDGWLLQGAAAFDHEDGPATVAYRVEVDPRWETKRGIISGFLGDQTVQHEIARDSAGWRLNGAPVEGLDHLVDLDFGFTPATNVLQLSRIALKLGQSAEVPVVWFDLDGASLIELPQTYERRSEASYWYEAPRLLIEPCSRSRPTASFSPTRIFGGLWRDRYLRERRQSLDEKGARRWISLEADRQAVGASRRVDLA
jgi:uncharacterized protein